MLDVKQLREHVVDPVLDRLDMHSEWAVRLVLGTAAVESGFRYIHQINGPALGLWQMEPATHSDIWDNYIRSRGRLRDDLLGLQTSDSGSEASDMIGNLYYACAMCRVHYWRQTFAIPHEDDIEAMGRIWKRVYNTPFGAGSARKFTQAYEHLVMPAL